MIDILTIDPTDRRAVSELVDLMHSNCTAEQCEQFLADLYAWDRSIPKAARPVIDAYTRMVRRGAFVPAIVKRYTTVTAGLEDTPEWQEILLWQDHIASLTADKAVAA